MVVFSFIGERKEWQIERTMSFDIVTMTAMVAVPDAGGVPIVDVSYRWQNKHTTYSGDGLRKSVAEATLLRQRHGGNELRFSGIFRFFYWAIQKMKRKR